MDKTRLLASILISALTATLLVLLPASGASADGGSECSGGALIGNCTVGNPKPNPGPNNPNPDPKPKDPGPGGGGGGGGGGDDSYESTRHRKTETKTTWIPSEAVSTPYNCAGQTNSNGNGAIGASYTRTYEVWQDFVGGPWNGRTLSESRQCYFPPTYRDTVTVCYLSSTVTINKVVPNKKTLATKTVSTSWGAGTRTIAACEASKSQVALGANPTEYGRYEALAVSRAQNATIRTYTSPHPRTRVTPAPEVVRVSGTFGVNVTPARGQLTCAGWTNGWTGTWGWIANDCPGNPEEGRYQCVVGNNIQVDHPNMTKPQRLTNVQILGSGEVLRATWDTPRVAGSSIVSRGNTKSRVHRAGEHWKPGAAITQQWVDLRLPGAGKTQLTSKDGTNWHSGIKNIWDVSLYGAGKSSYQLETGHDLVVRQQSVRITGINIVTGQWTTEVVTVHVPTYMSCLSPRLTVETLRVINGVG